MGRRRSTCACEARTPCRAGCGHVMHHKRRLHRRKATLHRRKTVLRRASCGLRCTAGFFAWRARERATALAVFRNEAQQACALATRARRTAPIVVASCMMQDHCTGEEPLFIGARPCCDVPAAASEAQPPFSRGEHPSAPLRSLSMGTRRSTRACDACAPCCAGCDRVMHGTRPKQRREASLHRCKTVVRCASYVLEHTAGFCVARTRARYCACCLLRRGAARALATRARHASLVVVDPYPIQGHRTAAPARRLSPSAQDRGAPCQLRPPRHSRLSRGAHASASLRSLSMGRCTLPQWLPTIRPIV